MSRHVSGASRAADASARYEGRDRLPARVEDGAMTPGLPVLGSAVVVREQWHADLIRELYADTGEP